MAGFTRQLTIDAPPSRVFAVLTDLDQAPQWMPAIQRTKWVEGTAVAPGARWTEWRTAGKRTMKAELAVAAFDANRRLDLRVKAPMFAMVLAFTLAPAGKGTQVDYRCEGGGRGLMALFTKPMMRSIERHDDDLLLRLKAECEAKAPAQASPKSKSKAAKKR